MSMLDVTLSDDEMFHSAVVGVRRRLGSLGSPRTRHFGNAEPWRQDIESATAEMAAAKALNMHWGCHEGVGKAPDIAPHIQVRWIDNPQHRCIIHLDENPNHSFVLVYGWCPQFYVIGHILGVHGMRKEYLENPAAGDEPAYFVPQDVLSQDWAKLRPSETRGPERLT